MTASIKAELEALNDDDLAALLARTEWLQRAHKHQKTPPGDWWHIHLLLAGRGSGKTRYAAEETWWNAWQTPRTRWLAAAPTAGDVLSVCFEGESGILNCVPRRLIKSFVSKPAELTLINDSIIVGIPASEPERYRGPQWHGVWLEELAAWQYDQEAFDMIAFANRLGQHPRTIITTTPKPRALIRELVKREGKDVVITRASTYANLQNLAPTFRNQILKYRGTQIGRQEIDAELLDPEEQGIVKRSQIRMWPASKPLPWFEYIIFSLDGALTEETRDKKTGDPDYSAAQVWGLFQHEKRANAMMLDAWQARLGLPDLIERLEEELKAEYGQMETPILRPLIGPSRVALETKKIDLVLTGDGGIGKSVRQILERLRIPAMAYNPGRVKKLDRLHAMSFLFAGGSANSSGVIWMTEGRRADKEKPGEFVHTGQFSSWAEPVIEQLCTFHGEGTIPHDDHVDACTQALRVLSDGHMLDTIRAKPPGTENTKRAEPPPNPYGQ